MYEAPVKLKQFYTVIPHHEKVEMLFSFINNQQTAKMIVFVSTVKQVRFLFEAFRKLRMGLPLFEYHGKQPQPKRTAIFFSFTECKAAVLICTNIAARGLDFPKVDWVFQYDCPENVELYVHRMGRTARFAASGKSLLILDPSESKFADKIKEKKFELNKISPNPDKQLAIKKTLTRMLIENDDIKYLAQRAFISFVKNIHNMPDKTVFNLGKVDCKKIAESFGLIQTPIIKVGGENITELKYEEGDDEKVKLNKNQRKLQKLKAKIAMKEQKDLPDSVIQKNMTTKLNQYREAPRIIRVDKVKEKEEDDDDFLIKKRNKDQLDIDKLIEGKSTLKRRKKDEFVSSLNWKDGNEPITQEKVLKVLINRVCKIVDKSTPKNCPDLVATAILQEAANLDIPELKAISTTPLVLPSGKVIKELFA